ncbi:hypothetical protein [Saccharicrinis aurantiacus]|uniref:hypothetical protein n=1 Tax=Saccharicrinis aurantiacus TaxID=1849719 RepID=UPI0024901426|nr:hypothetical protein [Saccharicrinis aurantiacus]
MILRLLLFYVSCMLFTEAKSQCYIAEDGLIRFSNFLWVEKVTSIKVGPGPNYFGLHKKNVFVDRLGNLHLSLKKKQTHWSCAEVITDSILKEGVYEVSFYSNNTIPNNVVFGLFLYDTENPPSYNEIDFELSKWNVPEGLNAQHVVHSNKDFIVNRFDLPKVQDETKHIFKVYSDSIFISSYATNPLNLLQNSVFRRPKAFNLKQAKFRMNLWLIKSPVEEQEPFEVVITSFNYRAF